MTVRWAHRPHQPTGERGGAYDPPRPPRRLRLHEQLAQTEDPDERDAIFEEMDEIEYDLGESYLFNFTGTFTMGTHNGRRIECIELGTGATDSGFWHTKR